MVECIVKTPSWYGGKPSEPGEVVSLTEADAQYGVSIGRVERVAPDANPAPAGDLPAEADSAPAGELPAEADPAPAGELPAEADPAPSATHKHKAPAK